MDLRVVLGRGAGVAALVLTACPPDDLVFDDVVDVDALAELDRENGIARDVRAVVGTDSPTLTGTVDLNGTEVEQLDSEFDGFHTTRIDWAMTGDESTREAFFTEGDEYPDADHFLGIDILDAEPDGTVWTYTAPGVRLVPGVTKDVYRQTGNRFDGFYGTVGFELVLSEGVKVVPVRFWRFVREDNGEGPEVTAENTRQWLDGARILPNPETTRWFEGGEPFSFWGTNLQKWEADSQPADQIVDSIYMQCPAEPAEGSFRYQFRFHSFSDIEVPPVFVDELLLQRGDCDDDAPFGEMHLEVEDEYPGLELPDPDHVFVEVFLVRDGGDCREDIVGTAALNDVALLMDRLDSYQGAPSHHYLLAHELGHVLGHQSHVNVVGNLMNGNVEDVGTGLTDEQCADFEHRGM